MPPPNVATSYRYPSEIFILLLTLFLVFAVIAFTASATFCLSAIFVIIAVGLAYLSSHSHHQELMRNAQPINAQFMPDLEVLIRDCIQKLQAQNVDVYVTKNPALNAYTFGLSDRKVIVLYSALFKVMDEDELKFIIGHELGHVRLGHTRLNSLVGGMAGIPSSSYASALLTMVFLWWNRACEYSADRAGLLACGKSDKAISALIKLVVGPQALTNEGMAIAYRQIDAEDDSFLGSIQEAFGTHPLLINRIEQLQSYAKSQDYRHLQVLINQNLLA